MSTSNTGPFNQQHYGTDEPSVSRRQVLGGLAAAGALALLPGALRAQTGAATLRRLDFHNHFGSPQWIKRVQELKPQGWNRLVGWTPEKQLELMERGGIQTGFVSCTEPGVWFGDDYSDYSPERDEAIALARDMNEYGARIKADFKGRFGLFAVLPIPDVDASLKEIEYAFDTLHADGVGVLTSYGDMWLGDQKLQPVFDELNRRKAIVYVHPTDSTCCHALGHMNPGIVEWLSDTGRAINSMVSTAPPYYGAGTPVNRNVPAHPSAATRYANVKFIWSHGGGSLLGVADRIAGFQVSNDILKKPAEPNSQLWHLRRFYYDTAQAANPILMQGLKQLVGVSQIVFGSDVPYILPESYNKSLTECGFTARELESINRGNALRTLLPAGWTPTGRA